MLLRIAINDLTLGGINMAFCSNCGKDLNSSARFCDGCGTPVSGAENKRNTVYEGDIHKCPHCGEVLNSFVVNCPSCGYELRDVQSSKCELIT